MVESIGRSAVHDYDLTYQLYAERLERAARDAERRQLLKQGLGPRPSLRSRVSFSLPRLHRRPRLVPGTAR
jgi:hypothetical protein